MTEEESKDKSESKAEVVEEIEEEEADKTIEQNIVKIDLLIDELNKANQKGGPDIRICPRCFSLRIIVEDFLSSMGISNSYPVCRCLDCGWRSKNWIYLDRKLSKVERDRFIQEIVEEKIES
ncbi:MAG: hypothetical protein HZR80_20515 [Candidatus Heimdallarchaeota archaeon]